MKIEGNILKHHLKNVLFVCGNACAGKTTMARMLAQKHGFHLYAFDDDEWWERHRAIADDEHQPHTCYHGRDFHEQWMRPIEEQARWSIQSLREQNEMAVVDLIVLSENQTVVADILFSRDFTKDMLDDRQIVFLTVDKAMIRGSYFNRPEKRGFYEFVKKQELADTYFENIFQSLELANELEQRMMRESGFLMLERTAETTSEETLAKMERHFGI